MERLRSLRPLSVRDFRLLWIGQTVSLLGNGFFTVALSTVIVVGLGAAGVTIIGWLRPGARDPELVAEARDQASRI